MPSFLKIPKLQLALILAFLYVTILIKYPTLASFYILFATVVFSLFFDLLFTFLRRRKLFIPYAAITTGFIIALLIDPSSPWYQIATICALAMGSKNFLRVSGRHIFNPAAFGLFVGAILFRLGVAWWGVPLIPPILLILPVLISGLRMRRFGSIVSFVIVYTLLTRFSNMSFLPTSFFNFLLDPTIIFFAIVMLPEPMTSPVTLHRQILYASSIAFVSSVLAYHPVSNFLSDYNLLPDIFIPALLLGNLLFFKYR